MLQPQISEPTDFYWQVQLKEPLKARCATRMNSTKRYRLNVSLGMMVPTLTLRSSSVRGVRGFDSHAQT